MKHKNITSQCCHGNVSSCNTVILSPKLCHQNFVALTQLIIVVPEVVKYPHVSKSPFCRRYNFLSF